MRRSKHMAKRAKGLKILKIVIILAITFLAGIIVTFCQKQANPVIKDENVTTQTTSSKPKKHKKSAATKKENGKDTKSSGTNNATAKTYSSNNESDRIARAKKALDEYCKGEHINGDEAELVDWYCKAYNISPQPEGDWWKDNDHYMGEFYSDDEPEENESSYETNDDAQYYVPNTTTNSSSTPAESYSSQTTAAEK